MRTTVTIFAVIGAAAALPGMLLAERDAKPWVAPGPDDSRGPCPGMNTLANHGYLPHNGKNISIEAMADANVEGFNMERGFITAVIEASFAGLGQDVIDLVDLNRAGVTEHDASLSREDARHGDNLLVSIERVDSILADSDSDVLTVASLAKSRLRLETSSPPLTEAHNTQSLLEAGFVLLIGGDVTGEEGEDLTALTATKEFLRTWFVEERLPTELGWKRAPVPLQGAWLQELGAAIGTAMGQDV